MTTVYGRVGVTGLERQKILARRNCQACGEEFTMAAYLGGDGLTDEQIAEVQGHADKVGIELGWPGRQQPATADSIRDWRRNMRARGCQI